MSYLTALIISVRPVQWLKNISVYAGIFLGGTLFEWNDFKKVTFAAIVFCGLSAATYLFNDSIDAPRDRIHPLKRLRPIASGALPIPYALTAACAITFCMLLAALTVDRFLFVLSGAYMVTQLFYSLFLRNVIILDAMSVALGFIIRVYAGAIVSDTPISSWLIVATIGLSLLLAFGKRRSERTLLTKHQLPAHTRETLEHYPEALLDSMISISASLAIFSYILFAFQTSPIRSVFTGSNLLPTTLLTPKWMMLTIPFVIYGVARYLYVIYEQAEGESPAHVLIQDGPLLTTLLAWAGTVTILLYAIGA